jgi:centromeric protein E
MNDRSSRSHAILKIVFEKRTVVNPKLAAVDKENFADLNSPSNDLVVKTTSVLNLVDLAGSESVRHTGASGMQKKEGGMINQR